MTPLIFSPIEVAKKCFLSEALMWVAFFRVPEVSWAENCEDGRFDPEQNCEYEAQPMIAGWPVGEEISDLECRCANLPPSPEYQALINDSEQYKGQLETLKKFLGCIDDEKKIREIEVEIKEARAFEKECASWEAKYYKYIEIPTSKLFITLREGQLKAFGRPLTHQNVDDSIAEIERNRAKGDYWSWQDIQYKEIPKDFWRIDSINWGDSTAIDGNSHYIHIYVLVKNLFEVFPYLADNIEGSITPVGDLRIVSGNLFWTDGDNEEIRKPSRSGRPPIINWDEFHLEITRRLQNDEIPDKQEALR